MAKHTPGPFSLMAGMPTNVLDSKGLRVARCDFDGDFDSPEAQANARLFHAAPDLLAACRLAKKQLDNYGLDWLGKDPCPLEAAIKKATA